MISNTQEKDRALQIAALAEDRLEPVADLANTGREVLFVMADTLKGEDVSTLAACKERLRGAGGRPFFIRACHRHGGSAGPVGLFDQTVVCGREDDLPLDLPAETVFSMLHGEFPLEREEILRPGRLVCFERGAVWESRSAQAADELCRGLRWEVDAARAEDGAFSRLLICMTVSPDVGMDAFDRCASALTEGGVWPDGIILQLEFTDRAPANFITVRGMVGTGS